jgi:hypothetical protein
MDMTERKIVTRYDRLAPRKHLDWCAYFDGDEEDESAPRGWGESEEAAIADLWQELDAASDDSLRWNYEVNQ